MYRFGERSKSLLVGVHPDLVAVAQRAIKITRQDFSVIEGLRTPERQQHLVQIGASRTLNSRHIDGKAIDVTPHPLSWHWPLFYPIAESMRQAALELDIAVVWGGCWDRTLLSIPAAQSMHDASTEYVARFRATKGRPPFMDAPHFELSREHY